MERLRAARKWLEVWGENFCENPDNQPQDKVSRALKVLVLTHKTSEYLAEHDPQALKQAQEALTGESWEKYL
jgi:hypothetical protein